MPEDGPAVTALIAASPPLDTNSAYANLLQCSHFADTCVLAERLGPDGRTATLMGWISAYRPPSQPDALFVWQVAVAEDARGLGLGRRMLDHILMRRAARDAQRLTTTITEDNVASWGLFKSFARHHAAQLHQAPHFERDAHFAGAHATEFLVTIGPLGQRALSPDADLAIEADKAALEAV